MSDRCTPPDNIRTVSHSSQPANLYEHNERVCGTVIIPPFSLIFCHLFVPDRWYVIQISASDSSYCSDNDNQQMNSKQLYGTHTLGYRVPLTYLYLYTPTNHSSSRKTRLNNFSHGIKIPTAFSFVLSQCTRLTDRRTDRILIVRPRLHSMQRGNEAKCSRPRPRPTPRARGRGQMLMYEIKLQSKGSH